jgi:hypothetical protein
MTSRNWFLLLVSVCIAAFASGAVLALTKGTKELGVALVVGSIFAISSFLGQVWTVQVQDERRLEAELWGADQRRYLQELLQERDRLFDEPDGEARPVALTPHRCAGSWSAS